MADLAEAEAEASYSASSTPSSNFDVFLNFRGEDTRNNFTGFLHKALQNRGINVFFDSERLWIGEAIGPALLRAIEGSKISIPIFSKSYASSKWCLLELSKILHCHRSNGQMVLPIFFEVEPSHVRNQIGSFEEPLQKHEENFKPHIVERWREALRVVGNLKGFVLKEDVNGDQAELVELVVQKVIEELINSTRLAECKYLIGIDSHVNVLSSLLQDDSNNVQFVGICGFGGIGKTTIAKAVYNRIFLTFNRHSFLSDVRERASQCMGLASLQKQLLEDILKKDIDICDHHRGKKLIEQRLCKENVLLVLDDVDSQEQVDALAGELNWFGPGSRIIITTRDEHILNVAKVDEDKIYRPHELGHMESLRLFSLHAFSMDQPPKDYMQLSHDVASYSGGLPLTLEVLGSYLSSINNKEIWKSTLEKLKKIPHEKVQKRLQISFDNLEDDYQKAIFLDAACFFIGWKKETVISIWEACGYHPESAIYRLVKRSLLRFEGCCLMMHDQIRDMGRNIVLGENLMDPGKHSRLWSHGEILEVLEEHKGTKIKGMILSSGFLMASLDSKHFQMMSNLKFLYVDLVDFRGESLCLPSALRWFRCKTRVLPTNFYHTGLVYLDLSCSMIEQAWSIGPQEENKRFQKLEVLNLSYCSRLSVSPNFSWFPCLVQLHIRNCNSLEKLDGSIGQSSRLKSLILDCCFSLEKLPESIGDLKSLTKLKLTYLRIQGLPDSISRLCSLKELILISCDSLRKIPKSIGDLRSLVKLQLNNVQRIEELPDGVGQLEKLEVLDVGECLKLVKLPASVGRMRCLHSINLKNTSISKLPDDLSHLKNLKQLELCKCMKLEYLPELPSSLQDLDCTSCDSLLRLPDLKRLKILETLELNDCIELEEIRGLEGTESLKKLDARQCYKLTCTPRKKILGQGTLSPYRLLRTRYYLNANDGIYNKGLILCLVLEFHNDIKGFFTLEESQLLSVDLEISVSICQKAKETRCLHTLRIENIEFTTHRDIIYIHHFKGFDWFGIPLQGKEAIKDLYIGEPQLYIYGDYPVRHYCRVKFREVLLENREPDQQKPTTQHSSATMVADFFNWSNVYELSHVQEKGETSLYDDTKEEEKERNNKVVDFWSSFGPVSEKVREQEVLPSPFFPLNNRDCLYNWTPTRKISSRGQARELDLILSKDDVASSPPLSLTSAPCAVKLNNEQPNIGNDVQGFPSDIDDMAVFSRREKMKLLFARLSLI